MKSQNLLFLSLKFVAKDMVGDVLYWPVWWYSRGLVDFIKKRLTSIKEFEENIGLTVWIVNWGKPMYGQYDLAGKIISFFVRTAGIFYKAVRLMLYFLCQLILVVFWLGLPVVAVIQLVRYFLA